MARVELTSDVMVYEMPEEAFGLAFLLETARGNKTHS
jgi:hypothetical protein